ncbi:glycosyltransferase [Candidatus Halobeggiatoa sp. HSG11]|nr:glycosyltransferase [Candidatus Halobeggiatoa sp. HSG11]
MINWIKKAITNLSPKKTLLFYRDFQGLTGGHLKVWHYFQHSLDSHQYQPKIYFSPNTIWQNNPWQEIPTQQKWETEQPTDCLFLAGTDWQTLPISQRQTSKQPIINLIQGLRHADPNQPLRQFLSHKAIRICVSKEVKSVLEATGEVNGPLFANPNGLDVLSMPASNNKKSIRLLIIGIKQIQLAQKIKTTLLEKGIQTTLLEQMLPRPLFLEQLAQADICLFLPCKVEGFYLPALEAMHLGSLVICPDCIGNRSFCLDKQTCLCPTYTEQAILAAIQQALYLSQTEKQRIITSAKQITQQHTLAKEKKYFLDILDNVQQLW